MTLGCYVHKDCRKLPIFFSFKCKIGERILDTSTLGKWVAEYSNNVYVVYLYLKEKI